MYNKKGQSEIITTVLIILLVLAAIVIVWQVVRSTVTTGANQITGGTDCITLGFKITGVEKGAAPSNVTVKRTAGSGDLSKLKFIINGSSKNESDASTLGETESRKFVLIGVQLQTNDVIEVAPILGATSNNKLCNVADTYKVA